MNRINSILVAIALVILSALTVFSQPLQVYSVCGNIASETLTIPSYRFLVIDKEGKQFSNLTVVGELLVSEHKWGHNYGDWNWEQTNHITKIPVTFDASEGLYVSGELQRIKVAFRKGFRRPNCLDRIERFSFRFLQGNEEITQTKGYSGLFGFNFENRRLDQFTLPDNAKPIRITLTNWDGTKSL